MTYFLHSCASTSYYATTTQWGPGSLLYTRPIQGFWRFLLHALSLSRLPCCCTTSSIAQPALRTPYYQTEGLSSVRHTVELCESTMLLCHLRACCTEAPIKVSVGDTAGRCSCPTADTRSKCVHIPCAYSSREHIVKKHQSWFLEVGLRSMVYGMD